MILFRYISNAFIHLSFISICHFNLFSIYILVASFLKIKKQTKNILPEEMCMLVPMYIVDVHRYHIYELCTYNLNKYFS